MRSKRIIVAAGSLLALCPQAAQQAGAQEAQSQKPTSELIASAPLTPLVSGGSNLTCYITNIGDKIVNLKSVKLIDPGGKAVELDYKGCGNSLGGRKTCGVGWNYLSGYTGMHCEASVSDASNVRGRLELRKGGEVVAATSFR